MESHIHPPEPVREKNSTQTISLIVGFLLCVLGLCGLQFPSFAGLHLSVVFSIITFMAGAFLFWNGYKNYRAHDSFLTCFFFGSFFGFITVVGWIFGETGTPTVGFQAQDPQLFKIIPGFIEIGRNDQILYGVISLVLFGGALDWYRRHKNEGMQNFRIHRNDKYDDYRKPSDIDHQPIHHH